MRLEINVPEEQINEVLREEFNEFLRTQGILGYLREEFDRMKKSSKYSDFNKRLNKLESQVGKIKQYSKINEGKE